MSTISPEAPPTVRQSVYWLSVLATRLQKGTSSVDTSRSTRVKTPNSNTRSLNHLAALLTRGKNDSNSMESTRIVAVTLGSFQADSIHLSVFASPPSSPTTSPTISPSSSSSGVADRPASAPSPSSPSSGVPPDGTAAVTTVDGKVASVVVTRNSLSGDEEGKCTSFIVAMAPAEPLLDIILAAPESFAPQPISFTQYAQQSLTLICCCFAYSDRRQLS
ncbi:hypothetical protein C8J57DRAFT_176855 [Mycena rebaudengoi]|nr:hypothetical protein C8J57DRAFT_176855 [Mycena rebaudengoi]